jgi:glycosyltransferase involved in cell wall biosynthesis
MVVPPWYEVPPKGYGGLEVIAAALIDGLVGRGHDVTLFGAGTQTGTLARFISTDPVLQHPFLGELLPALAHTGRVNMRLQEGDFDVVHDHTTDGPSTALHRHQPTVVTVHGPPVGELGDYLASLGDSVRLVAISRTQRMQRPELAWAATIHNALPDSVIGPARPANHDGPVMWLARFNPDKGPDTAIKACRAAGLPLVLAGKATEAVERRYLDEHIRPMLGDGVELVLNGEREYTQELLSRARCLIMPVRWPEPFGMVMIEAMSMGTPVVALRSGAVPELVNHGVTGWICETEEELPVALQRTNEIDPKACVLHVEQNFSASLMARRYERVYLEAVDEVRSPFRSRRLVETRPQSAPILRRPERPVPYVR